MAVVATDEERSAPSAPFMYTKVSRQEFVDEIDLTPRPSYHQSCRVAVKRVVELPNSSLLAVAVQSFIVGLICLSSFSVILETIPGMENHRRAFSVVENVVTALFTVEIFIRIWIADSLHAYFTTCSNVVDIIVTLPGYVEWFLASSKIDPFWRVRTQHMDPVWSMTMLRILQIVRLMRIVRIAKAARHSEVVTTVMLSFRASLSGLSALIVFVGSSAVFSATVVFWTEAFDKDTDFTSIPASLWWSLATITGVGYGDMVPMTTAGKAAGACTMVMGVLAISMSVAIITTAFMEEYRKSVALVKLERLHQLRICRAGSFKSGGREPLRERKLSVLDENFQGVELSPFALPDRPDRSSFDTELGEHNVLATFITLERSTKDILAYLEATALHAEKSVFEDPSPPSRQSFTASHLVGLAGSPSSGMAGMAGMKTALALLREQNAVWFKQATQLAETILAAEGPGEEPPSPR